MSNGHNYDSLNLYQVWVSQQLALSVTIAGGALAWAKSPSIDRIELISLDLKLALLCCVLSVLSGLIEMQFLSGEAAKQNPNLIQLKFKLFAGLQFAFLAAELGFVIAALW